jgi:xanthine/CO dehydrogenase XdhC/CoxF family maturation factor
VTPEEIAVSIAAELIAVKHRLDTSTLSKRRDLPLNNALSEQEI